MIEALAVLAAGTGLSLGLYGINSTLGRLVDQLKRLIDSLPTVPASGEEHGN